MAKKPTPQTPGGKGKGGGGPPLSQAGGGWRGKAPAHHHPHHTHHHHKPGGGPMTPGGPGGPPLSKAGGGWVGKAPTHKKAKKHPKRKLAGTPLDGGWILGGNDAADNCAAVAVANALLLSSGLRTSDAELARLHGRAGPLSIAEALTALGCPERFELPWSPREETLHRGGYNPRENPLWPLRVRSSPGLQSLLLGVGTPAGTHAVLAVDGGLVTWGGLLALPDDWDIEEAWAVTW
jgi:hypothetical protein